MNESSPPPKAPYEKTLVQIPLDRLLKYIIGPLDRAPVDLIDGQLLSMVDHEERFIHVQFVDLKTGEKLEKPIVWNKKDWKATYAEHLRQKQNSELRRSSALKQSENIQNVMKKLMVSYHLDEKQARHAAERMVIDGDHKFLNALGIHITERTEEEKKALGNVTYINPLKKNLY
jgi:hypothetical protein